MATTTQAIRVTQKGTIVYIGKDLGYLDAVNLVRDKGGLPSTVLHDDILVRSERWKKLRDENYYAAWARELLVYPEKNGVFSGKDVVDAYKDDKGREWRYPAELIKRAQDALQVQIFGTNMVGLFVDPGSDPKSFEITDKRVTLVAPVLKVITPFIQNSGEVGLVDEETRVPTFVEKSERQNLTDDQKRWLYRIDGAGVRPLVRGYALVRGYDFDYVRRDVDGVLAGNRHDGGFGAGWVSQIPSWLVALQSDADAAKESISKLGVVDQKYLEPVRRLLRNIETLDIKE